MLSSSEHRKLQKYVQRMDVTRLSTAFDALGEPNRCLIFRALLKTSHATVGQLADALDLSDSLASQHLKTLREAGLIVRRKEGKRVYYDVNSDDALVVVLEKIVED